MQVVVRNGAASEAILPDYRELDHTPKQKHLSSPAKPTLPVPSEQDTSEQGKIRAVHMQKRALIDLDLLKVGHAADAACHLLSPVRLTVTIADEHEACANFPGLLVPVHTQAQVSLRT